VQLSTDLEQVCPKDAKTPSEGICKSLAVARQVSVPQGRQLKAGDVSHR
jgi:hypothetical protein